MRAGPARWTPGHVRRETPVWRRALPVAARAVPYAGWPLVVLAALTALLRVTGATGQAYLALALGLLPLTMLPCYAVAVAAGVTRHRVLAAVAAALALTHLVFVWPAVRPAPDVSALARGAPTLTLLSFNSGGDRVDPRALARMIARARPDVVVLLELGTRTAKTLDAAGLATAYPHRLVAASERPLDGAGLYSRLPLAEARWLQTVTGAMPGATVLVGGVPVRVQGVHVAPPLGRSVGRWQAEHAALATLARDRSGPLVLAGDFNAGRQHPEWRSVVAAGLTDADEARGRGLVRTWPDDHVLLPDLLDLDHVLVSPGLVVLDVRDAPGLGSDHRALLADLAVVSPDTTARR